MLDSWELTINKFGVIKFSNSEGYRISYLLCEPPSCMEIYRGYKVYMPFESFDIFRSFSFSNAIKYVEASKKYCKGIE